MLVPPRARTLTVITISRSRYVTFGFSMRPVAGCPPLHACSVTSSSRFVVVGLGAAATRHNATSEFPPKNAQADSAAAEAARHAIAASDLARVVTYLVCTPTSLAGRSHSACGASANEDDVKMTAASVASKTSRGHQQRPLLFVGHALHRLE